MRPVDGHPPDRPTRQGLAPGRGRLGIRGTDLAGTVAAIGRDVTRLSAGDEVFGVGSGTFAEYAAARDAHLVPKPADITFEQGAAAGMAALTALQALRDSGRVRAGQGHARGKVVITP